jgi:DNA-binding IclR family transcriptional regulator
LATPKTRSVVKAFTLLQSFRRADEWLTCAELSRRAKLPEASGYRLLQTLEEIGAVVRDTRGFRPGMLLVSLTQGVTGRDLLREVSLPILKNLSTRLGKTAHIGVLEEGMVTYVAKMNGPDEVITKVGAQLEAYCTGLGKVLLAGLPPHELAAFLSEGELVPLTERTIVNPSAFRAEITKVRRQGFAIDDREIIPDLRCVAVPICDADGGVVAAMSASDVYTRMGPEELAKVRTALMDASAAITRKLYPSSANSAHSNVVRLAPIEQRAAS